MKKIITSLALIGLLAYTGSALASPVTLDVANSPYSSVTVTEHNGLFSYTSALSADLYADLGDYNFTLADNESTEIDFFTLTATGIGIDTYTIAANLAFDSPQISGSGSGGGLFGTFLGMVSGGMLYWGNQPGDITLADGNVISIQFENGIELGYGNTARVHATIMNHGGAPVPLPASILLLGSGLAGLLGAARSRRSRAG